MATNVVSLALGAITYSTPPRAGQQAAVEKLPQLHIPVRMIQERLPGLVLLIPQLERDDGVLALGRSGFRISFIAACSGVRPPFRALQRMHEQTRFSHVSPPPWARGLTWSMERSLVGKMRPQYWHLLRSRAKRLRRLSFTVCSGMRS